MVKSSALRGEFLKSHLSVERALAEGIAERIGADPERDLYPRLMAGAVSSAVRVAIDHWLESDSTAAFVPTLTYALGQLAAGLPAPAAESSGISV
jgi:hypothetical protein